MSMQLRWVLSGVVSLLCRSELSASYRSPIACGGIFLMVSNRRILLHVAAFLRLVNRQKLEGLRVPTRGLGAGGDRSEGLVSTILCGSQLPFFFGRRKINVVGWSTGDFGVADILIPVPHFFLVMVDRVTEGSELVREQRRLGFRKPASNSDRPMVRRSTRGRQRQAIQVGRTGRLTFLEIGRQLVPIRLC